MSTAPGLEKAPEFLAESPIMSHPQVRALIKSVFANGQSFNTLEHEIFKILSSLLVQMLRAILEKLDEMLMYSAIRQGWAVTDRHRRELETSLGIVSYERRYYKKQTATGKYIYGHLLDDILGIEKGKNISPRLVQMAVTLAADNSYRNTSKLLEEVIGVKISHESIRQAVLDTGEHISKWDKRTGLDRTGRKEVPLLIIEADGANLKKQLRKKAKKGRKQEKTFEMKTAVIYEGWEKGPSGRGKLKVPQYFVHGGESKEFWGALERHLSRTYCLEGCKRIIVGGDGATWVRQGAEMLGAEYQYCQFHLERDLRRLFGEIPDIKLSIKKTLKNKDHNSFNMILDALQKDEENVKRKTKLEAFQSLINSVWEGILDWRERGKPTPENARGLGVIEANVGHTVARRFKNQCASWSPGGAHDLAKVRCAVRNGNLIELIELPGPPEADEIIEETKLDIFNGYWARKEADGMKKADPAQWCKVSMPAAYGSKQRARELAKMLGQLTTDWLF